MTDWAEAMRKGDNLKPIARENFRKAVGMFATFEGGKLGKPCRPYTVIEGISDPVPGEDFCVVLTD